MGLDMLNGEVDVTPHERNELAKEVVDEMVARKDFFYVEPEEHYNSHKELDQLLSMVSKTSSTVFKTVLTLFIVGILAAILIAVGWKK